ncbi:hypothetical protein FB451DRAFT_1172452 [Mycena latifolia]|nr:hypothetical protein FB451DRAFT_1172452 [Mycena latifolia]
MAENLRTPELTPRSVEVLGRVERGGDSVWNIGVPFGALVRRDRLQAGLTDAAVSARRKSDTRQDHTPTLEKSAQISPRTRALRRLDGPRTRRRSICSRMNPYGHTNTSGASSSSSGIRDRDTNSSPKNPRAGSDAKTSLPPARAYVPSACTSCAVRAHRDEAGKVAQEGGGGGDGARGGGARLDEREGAREGAQGVREVATVVSGARLIGRDGRRRGEMHGGQVDVDREDERQLEARKCGKAPEGRNECTKTCGTRTETRAVVDLAHRVKKEKRELCEGPHGAAAKKYEDLRVSSMPVRGRSKPNLLEAEQLARKILRKESRSKVHQIGPGAPGTDAFERRVAFRAWALGASLSGRVKYTKGLTGPETPNKRSRQVLGDPKQTKIQKLSRQGGAT